MVDVIYLDFSNAVDAMYHKTSYAKLIQLGYEGTVINDQWDCVKLQCLLQESLVSLVSVFTSSSLLVGFGAFQF